MPELAEVEFGRKLADRVATGRRIIHAHCDNDAIVFEDGPSATVSALTGALVNDINRHGKYIWFGLDRQPWPIFHFGMTGAFRVPGVSPLELESKIQDPQGAWPPRFTKIRLHFDDGGELVMTNARRLGRIRLRPHAPQASPIADLGFDPYTQLPDTETFFALLRKRGAKLKALLLDQKFAAGIGNWLADEILFQARLDPRRSAGTLDQNETLRLLTSMKEVIHTAVEVNADKNRFPSSWLFHHRWGKQRNAEVEGGYLVEHMTLAGRTTAWVPALQR
ncbi:MAG: hypothetical protein KTR25_00135 [Myxococcales bacterium]|nr:hypothetical protein [Myxococcales bacterium]